MSSLRAREFLHRQRIEKIKTKAEERGKVFGEINEAREEAHRQTCARNENKQSAIEANVNRWHFITSCSFSFFSDLVLFVP